MTKAELIADLSSKFKNVGTPEILETVGAVRQYLVNFLEVGADGAEALKRNAFFYTFREGTQGEEAYFKTDASAKPVVPMTEFRKLTAEHLDTLVLKGEVLKYRVASVDDEIECVEARCLVEKNADAEWQNRVIYRLSGGKIESRKLV